MVSLENEKKKDITFTGMQLLIQYDIKWINPKGF